MSDNPDDDEPGKVQLDRHGDPLRQGSLMVERQSYEQMIAGLRIAAEAFMHLAAYETTEEGVNNRRGLALRIDQCRRICIQHAGIEDPVRSSPTAEVRGRPLPWKDAYKRVLDGLMRATNAAFQLASCQRGDLWWTRVAMNLQDFESSVRQPVRRTINPLLLPTGYVTRH